MPSFTKFFKILYFIEIVPHPTNCKFNLVITLLCTWYDWLYQTNIQYNTKNIYLFVNQVYRDLSSKSNLKHALIVIINLNIRLLLLWDQKQTILIQNSVFVFFVYGFASFIIYNKKSHTMVIVNECDSYELNNLIIMNNMCKFIANQNGIIIPQTKQ